jgi:ERCC4-type nuclease
VERTSLPVGDIWIVARRYLYTEGEDDDNTEKEDAVLAIVERKTVNDLWSSLRDGRYHDQDSV